ncbi:MAG: hypothetical protein VYB54_07575 [Pseudomonadota bacterium]|nr:hypothetical protein [Pseudomonadota bacterium]
MGNNPYFPRGKTPRHQSDPSWKGVAITPGATELTDWPRSVRCGTGGTLVVVDTDDTELIFTNVADGETIPMVVKKVLAQSSDSPPVATDCDDIVGYL